MATFTFGMTNVSKKNYGVFVRKNTSIIDYTDKIELEGDLGLLSTQATFDDTEDGSNLTVYNVNYNLDDDASSGDGTIDLSDVAVAGSDGDIMVFTLVDNNASPKEPGTASTHTFTITDGGTPTVTDLNIIGQRIMFKRTSGSWLFYRMINSTGLQSANWLRIGSCEAGPKITVEDGEEIKLATGDDHLLSETVTVEIKDLNFSADNYEWARGIHQEDIDLILYDKNNYDYVHGLYGFPSRILPSIEGNSLNRINVTGKTEEENIDDIYKVHSVS